MLDAALPKAITIGVTTMSVTFTFGQYVEDPNFGTVLMCGIQHNHTCPTPDTCEDFSVYRTCDHIEDAKASCECERYDVNMSNVNAQMVLSRLGYSADDGDLAGEALPDDLLGRAMLANVGHDDSGIAAVEGGGQGHARWIECGVEAGYFAGRMAQLAELATEAKARGLLVTWA
jgi:hypothetical protein